MLLLRTYVLGDKMINFEFLSDQKENFPDSFLSAVNYEDMNLNVSIPVFSIHGNHDDMSNGLSSMDTLSSAGLLNYFGKWKDLSEIDITPIILKKNKTQIGLYGLSHIHDARLARLFRDKKVNVHKPDIPDEKIFNLMVLHQNRVDRGRLSYIPEDKLPGFLDLVVWGHEHDCRIEPEPNGKTKTYITQPGSSVATSLSEGESIEKKIGILDVCEKEFKMNAVRLKTVRPFIFRTVNIEEYAEKLRLGEGDTRKKVEAFYTENIEEMIEESKKRLSGHPKQPKSPLIRLRITYTNESFVINTARFGQRFEKVIANPESVLTFKKNFKKKSANAYSTNEEALKSAFEKKEQTDRVENVVEAYFKDLQNDKDKLQLFDLSSLTEVCRLLVDKDDETGASNIVSKHFENAVKFMEDKMCQEEDIPEAIAEFQATKSKETLNQAIVENSRAFGARDSKRRASDDNEDDEDEQVPTVKGRGRGRAAAGVAKTTRGKGKAAEASVNASVSSAFGLDVQRNRSVLKPQTQATSKPQRGVKSKLDDMYLVISDSD